MIYQQNNDTIVYDTSYQVTTIIYMTCTLPSFIDFAKTMTSEMIVTNTENNDIKNYITRMGIHIDGLYILPLYTYDIPCTYDVIVNQEHRKASVVQLKEKEMFDREYTVNKRYMFFDKPIVTKGSLHIQYQSHVINILPSRIENLKCVRLIHCHDHTYTNYLLIYGMGCPESTQLLDSYVYFSNTKKYTNPIRRENIGLLSFLKKMKHICVDAKKIKII